MFTPKPVNAETTNAAVPPTNAANQDTNAETELSTTQEPDVWVPAPKTYWPTKEEVREIVGAIIRHIDQTPDWTPKDSPKLESADETWKGWGRK